MNNLNIQIFLSLRDDLKTNIASLRLKIYKVPRKIVAKAQLLNKIEIV